MQCPQCRAEAPSDAKFCSECGSKLMLVCAQCRTENSPSHKFCKECGAPLQPAAAAPAARFASPQTYTPKYLAERILTSKSSLEGERKQVTVLFADLKGSMELLADRDPEDARKLLDAVLSRMMEAVHRYEGTVNQVMGDGVMALFGAPLALEDHALRACYAALAIQNSMKAYGEEALREHGIDVHVRVGLNSGEVVVRAIGSDLKMDYTAVGQTTHLASRMEQLAPPGSIRLTGDTLRLAEGFLQVESLGPVPVKGLEKAVEVYELKGATSGRTRFQATAAGGLSRFVGRQNELEDLKDTLERAGGGHGQVFATVAEAGVGKSRLYWEFIRSPRTKGWLIVESGSVSYGKATAYKPVIDLLKAYFSVEDADGHRRIREKVTGKVLTLDESLTPAIPPILSLLDVPVEDEGWKNLDPAQRRRRTLDGVKGLLLREAKAQPLVLVFEDLHWIDSETQAFLDGLVESLPGARVLLLVNYRPEYEHGWANKTCYTRLRLDPLSSEGAEELLQAILGGDQGLGPLKKLLSERTQGNPFYLEESVQTLIESGTLAGGPGAYRLMEEISRIQVPSTVQAILAARIDRLAPDDKRLLQTASVIGTHVSYPLLAAVAEMSEEELNRGLASLQRAEFLYETNLFPEREFTFKHALTHEVTYGSLVQERKRALHAAIVEAIERLAGERLEEQVERLAHHAYEAEAWEKALTYLRHAGSKAMARPAYREAVVCFEHTLAALKHLPESRETLSLGVDLRFDLRTSLQPLGEFRRIFDLLSEAETLAEALDDKRRLGWASAYKGQYFWRMGENDRAMEASERAVTIASAIEDFSLKVTVNYFQAWLYIAFGDICRARDHAMWTVDSLKGDLQYQRFGLVGLPSVMARAVLVWSLAELGEFAEGVARTDEALQIVQAAEQPFSFVHAFLGVGHLYLRKGEFGDAIRALGQGAALCQAFDISIWFPWVTSSLGYSYALSGRVAEGFSLLEQALEKASALGLMGYQSLRVAYLGEAHLLAGRKEEALQQAARALQLSREHKERGSKAWVLRLLGEIHSDPDALDAAKAEDFYRQALALAEELGMRPLAAHCRAGLGRLYQRTGQEEDAKRELARAVEMYRAMGMDFFLRQAEEALAKT